MAGRKFHAEAISPDWRTANGGVLQPAGSSGNYASEASEAVRSICGHLAEQTFRFDPVIEVVAVLATPSAVDFVRPARHCVTIL